MRVFMCGSSVTLINGNTRGDHTVANSVLRVVPYLFHRSGMNVPSMAREIKKGLQLKL